MELSNLTAAFNKSSDAAKSSISQDGFQSQAEDRAFITAEDRPDMDPGFETKAAEDSELTPGDITDPGFDPGKSTIPNVLPRDPQSAKQTLINSGLTQEDILAIIQRDVDFSYDEKTNTFNIVSGEIKPSTMDAVRAYFDMADGKYDEANIVVGEDVTFETQLRPSLGLDGLGHYTEAVPSFAGIKCNSIDIQSQNIINGDKMFAGADADIIKVADQPNLKSANNMFNGCTASAVVLGELPEGFSGKESAESGKIYSLTYMFNGCEAIVMNSDLTDVIYDPAEQNAVQILPEIVNPHITPNPGQKINPSIPKIEIDPDNTSDSEKKMPIEKIREWIESKYKSSGEPVLFSSDNDKGSSIVDKIQDRAKQAMDALGLDGVSDPTSVEKSDVFEK